MNEEMKSQKEEFLLEVQKQILHKGLKSEMQENGRLHVKWNDQPLCEVDEYGRAWCRPVSVTCPEMKKSLRAVSKTASQVWEYMQIFARAHALKANGADGSYKILADFGEAVLAGRLEETGAKFATWQWEFDRNSVRVGHYFMEDYKSAKRDFAARSKLVESQRILSDAELAAVRNACEFMLKTDKALTFGEQDMLLHIQEESEFLLSRQREPEQEAGEEPRQLPTMEQIPSDEMTL